MTCRKAQLLIGLYLAPAGGLSAKGRQALGAHLAVCERCRRDYEESAEGIVLFQKHWHISEDTQALIDRAKRREEAGLPIDPLWRYRRLLEIGIPTVAVAACLAVLLLGWWVLSS
jgi:anti-sigma factor RsiW